MSLQPGQRLGPYEITARIGAGGMGEVWQAKDTRLERQVAIKVLPQGFAANETLRARFEREAKAISALSHPNICTLFDIGNEDDTEFLVMELLEGESLADRLERGALPFAEVLTYGAQIADALDAAHRQGIIHRDLKPANVMLTRSGAKLLDFGLARVAAEAAPVTEMTQTVGQRPLTEEGTILGTFQYMSPEQLEGQEAGPRTDIFGLGALLYEMATGSRAFQGETRTSLIAAIVSSVPPPVSTMAQMTPPAFDHVVRTCLEKDPDDRWQSARDVANQLRWIGTAGSEAGVARSVASARRVKRRTWIALAAAGWLVAAAVGLWTAMNTTPDKPRVVRTFTWPIEQLEALKISPDGSRLMYAADDYVHIHELDDGTTHRLDDTRGVIYANWSPDGRTIAFISSRNADGRRLAEPELRRLDPEGGSSTTIARIKGVRGVAFGDNETLYFATGERGGSRVFSVPVRGGESTLWWDPASNETIFPGWGFSFLPDGKTLLGIVDDGGRRSLALRSEDRFERLVTAPEDGEIRNAYYSPTGHVLYDQSDSPSAPRRIWALPFDASSRSVTGPPVMVLENAFLPSPAADGSLWFTRPPEETGPEQLVIVDRSGKVVERVGQPQESLTSPALSPDGSVVAVKGGEGDDTEDIWLHDVQRTIKTRLSWDVIRTWRPTWSPDGRRLAFQSRDRRDLGRSDLYVQEAHGRNPPQKLIATELDEYGPNWSPDGRTIVYTVTKEDNDRDIWMLDVESGETRPFLETRFRESMPYLSPDGSHVVYNSNRTGQLEVFVTSFPEPGREIQISSEGGYIAQWREGEIVYNDIDSESFWSVPVTTSPELTIGNPERLFSEDEVELIVYRPFTFDFAVTPDANRFIFVQDLTPEQDREVGVLQNWTAVLE
jgi:Tol biopolymer transport system component